MRLLSSTEPVGHDLPVPDLVYPLTAETSLSNLLPIVLRRPEQSASARFVCDRQSCSVGWTGGACGFDEKTQQLWVTRKERPAPRTFGREPGGWRATVRSELARTWLWLRPAPAPAQVLWDLLVEGGLPISHLPPLVVAYRHRDSLCEVNRSLACQALDATSDREQIAAAWGVF
jgi:hypothetical protein